VKSNISATASPPARLEELLPRWREIPLYRNAFAPRGPAVPPFDFPTDFFRLPFITKRDMREGFPRNFLRAGQVLEELLDRELVEMEHTSGTSEEQTPVLFGRGWWNEQEERALRLNAVVARVLDEHPHARRATLTTPVCNGQACYTNWLAHGERTVGSTLYVNLARIPFLLKDADFARMAAEITAWSPLFLDTDPVHATWFALYCERHGLRFPSLRFILGSYEFVSVVHRRILERVFGVPVFNLYGSTETGHLLMEDEHGVMRPSPETAFLEIVDPDAAGVGDLVVTTLSNDYMPLVRYRIGDLVQRLPDAAASDPAYIVHGRARDALRQRDGRRVTTHDVDQCFADIAGVAHYQLRQFENGGGRLDFVADRTGPSAPDLQKLTARLETLLDSPQPIVAAPTDALPPTPSGKVRLTYQA
jgi:phenylacetate-CoA ligase